MNPSKLKPQPRLCALAFLVLCLALSMTLQAQPATTKNLLRFGISFSKERSQAPLDGRVLLMVSADSTQEPRFQINDDADTQQIFGLTVDGLKPAQEAVIDAAV
ncbi:MAG: hypothetical protein ACRENG_32245, partial [bacterium]